MNNKEKLSNIWNSYSKINREKIEEYRNFPFFEKIQLKKPDVILDVGCGAGAYISMFLKYSDHVVGIDISQKMATSAYAHSSSICLSDLRHLPFKAEIFDFTYSMVAINYVENWKQAISEMERVLKPEGFCLIVSSNTYSILFPLRKLFHLFKVYKYGATYHASISSIEAAGKSSNLIVEQATIKHRVTPYGKTIHSILYSLLTRLDKLIGLFLPWWGAESVVLFKKPNTIFPDLSK